MELGDMNPARRHAWEARWRERPSFRAAANRDRFAERSVRAIKVDGVDVGTVAIGFGPPDAATSAFVEDVEIDPEHRGRGLGRRAKDLLVDWARGRGASQIRATTTPSDPAATSLFGDFPVISRHLRLAAAAVERREDPTVVPMTAEAYPRWCELMLDDFTASFGSATGTAEAEARANAEQLLAVMLPDGVDTADSELWMIDEDGPAAFMWLHPRPDSDEVYIQDVVVEEHRRGRGLGRRIMGRAAETAAQRGLTSMRLHVFAHNATANALYDRLGYRPVAEHRRRPLGG